MKFKMNRTLTLLLFSAGVVATLTVFILKFLALKEYRETIALYEKTEALISLVQAVEKSTLDLETGQRGYVLTQNEQFLKPYMDANDAIEKEFETLEKSAPQTLKVRPEYQALSELVRKKIEISEEVINKVRVGKLSAAIALVKSGEGKDVMDRLREAVNTVITNERARVLALKKESEITAQRNQLWQALGTGMAFVLIIVAFFMTEYEGRQRRKLEKQLVHARNEALQASQMKSSFLANMSHEIRTPMNGILGMTEVLLDQNPESGIKKKIQIIRESALNLLSLINGILDLSKIESGKLELEESYFEPRKLIQEVINTVDYSAKSKGLELHASVSEQTPAAFSGDVLRLRQILINLLGNAIKFSSEGTVSLALNSFRSDQSRTMLQIQVKDQGLGMDEATLAKIFSPFEQADKSTTRKFGGTGLGLSITKQLVELMNGKIEVESRPGEGSTFWVTLPLEAINVMPENQRPSESQNYASSEAPLKILVAEDNMTNQEVVKVMLNRLGHKFDIVNNGKEALEKTIATTYDIILMDCHMPVMDGYEAAQKITERFPQWCQGPAVIAVTANAIRGDKEACLAAGMCDYLSKPLTLAELDEKLGLWSRRLKYAATQVVDPKAMENLRQISPDMAPELMKQILQAWGKDAPAYVLAMIEAEKRGDLKDLADRAHYLKSSCVNAGLRAMGQLCSEIEKQARADTKEELRYLILQLRSEYKMACTHLWRSEMLAVPQQGITS
ncbi:ATP-binding protein [Bdellovibrio bacteriovorus]|uniref:Sensory/regulatory protein RpfC n=1 Tax=Bdellovibrio bacteriovorus str. Tiberius TaxID=1069642 RepID=K7Z1S5_BDEBC|nr:ATP-binding protein [Bdellovibrio bacteriovorus]AFY03020.1 sensory transduction histidine kinase [Bdellovibrio bacteriovorus str. Tiberius]